MNKKLLSLIILLITNFAYGSEAVWDLTFDKKYSLPNIIMNLEGEKIALTLDTGTKEALHLPIELIDKIPNKSENSQKIRSIDLSGNMTESRTFIINELELNSFIFKRVEVVEYKNWGLSFSSSNDNNENNNIENPVIGLGLFDGYVLTINYPESKIIISDETDIAADLDKKWIPIPFHINGEGLVIDMSDGIKSYKMVLDTGATMSVIKKQSLSAKTIKKSDDESDYKFVSLKANNVVNDNIDAVILDSLPTEFQSDGLIGFDFLSKNIVKIDFKNKQLWIQTVTQ
jgi:predicted aspartyl protease